MSDIPDCPKKKIILNLWELIIANPPPYGVPIENQKMALKVFFVDPRLDGCLLLTDYGFDIFKKAGYKYWSQEISTSLKTSDYVFLIRASNYPYHLKNKILSTFDRNLGSISALLNGDIELIKRNN